MTPFATPASGSSAVAVEHPGPSRARLKLWIARLLLVGLILGAANLQVRADQPLVEMDGLIEGALDPRGFAVRYTNSETGEAVRYDPCTPIHYVVNPDLSPPGAVEDIHTAVRMTAEASGLEFVYDGETDEVPTEARSPYQPQRYGDRWAPILIAWSEKLMPIPGTNLRPLGRAGSIYDRNDDGELVYVSGEAVFDAGGNLPAGFGGETWGQVFLHELGHVVGLDHYESSDSVMNSTLGLRPAAWGPGDRRGLWSLGLGGSCVRVPDLP